MKCPFLHFRWNAPKSFTGSRALNAIHKMEMYKILSVLYMLNNISNYDFIYLIRID